MASSEPDIAVHVVHEKERHHSNQIAQATRCVERLESIINRLITERDEARAEVLQLKGRFAETMRENGLGLPTLPPNTEMPLTARLGAAEALAQHIMDNDVLHQPRLRHLARNWFNIYKGQVNP